MPYRSIEPVDLSPNHLDQLDARILKPHYDRSRLRPGIVHIGVGGFHRAHQAEYLDDLCNDGLEDWSITGVGVLPGDSAMAQALWAQNCLYSLVTRSQNEQNIRIVGSLVEYMHAADDMAKLVDLLASPSTRIVSMTITEGGYPIDVTTGQPADASSSPTFSAIARALARRMTEGLEPFTVLSCDNVLHNGEIARAATLGAAEVLAPQAISWIETTVTFPNSMVDRITPVTTAQDREMLEVEYHLRDRWPVMAEPFRQWVLEDRFVAGRPDWESVGAVMTEDVTPYEQLKLRILNAGHSALAYLASLVEIELVDQVLADAQFEHFLRQFLNREAKPVLPDVPGVAIDDYIAAIIERLSNPKIGDQVSRLCLDGSSKFPTFLIPTIKLQLEEGGPLGLSALALAGWCQYLLGRADSGSPISVSADPNREKAIEYALASQKEPAAFLGYGDVFGSVSDHPRFKEAFVNALLSLRAVGTRATIQSRLTSDE